MDSMLVALLVCLSAGTTMAQFFGEEGGGGFLLYTSLLQRVQALESNVRTGAIGGCESGIVGPFTPLQRTLPIQFRRSFLTPPSISLAVSDLIVGNIALPLNFQIRPQQVNQQGAIIAFIDNTNTVASTYVSYMACPNNASPYIPSGSGFIG